MRFENAFEGMGAGPVIAAAAAAGILIGVVGGTSIDTTPLQRGKSWDQLVPDRQIAARDRGWDAPNLNLPDHYPQVTRNGRIEVWELRSYILRHERPAEFADTDFAQQDSESVETASQRQEPIAAEDPAAPGEVGLSSTTVPGGLQQAAVPALPLLEPATIGEPQPTAAIALFAR